MTSENGARRATHFVMLVELKASALSQQQPRSVGNSVDISGPSKAQGPYLKRILISCEAITGLARWRSGGWSRTSYFAAYEAGEIPFLYSAMCVLPYAHEKTTRVGSTQLDMVSGPSRTGGLRSYLVARMSNFQLIYYFTTSAVFLICGYNLGRSRYHLRLLTLLTDEGLVAMVNDVIGRNRIHLTEEDILNFLKYAQKNKEKD